MIFKTTAINRSLFFLVFDILLSMGTIFLAYLIRFRFVIPDDFVYSIAKAFVVIIPIKVLFLALFKQYSISWRFYSFEDSKNLLKAHIFAYLIAEAVVVMEFDALFIPKSILVIDFFFSLVLLSALRFAKRMIMENSSHIANKAIFIGANAKTQELIKRALKGEFDYFPIAIYDNEQGYLSNIKIEPIDKIAPLSHTAIITKSLSKQELDQIVQKLTDLGVNDIKVATDFENRLKDISIEDLLQRQRVTIDSEKIKQFIHDKVILITGAGGSIGSELLKQCEAFGAKSLIMVDKCEYNLYTISMQVDGVAKLCCVKSNMLEEIFDRYRPDIVFHAAAYKHVPICQQNPNSCIENNIFGSINVINLAIKYGVDTFINVSTDKAVHPTNVMGATKRVVEMYAKSVNCARTKIASVRFGNVMQSSGSVVPFFKQCIKQNKDLPVTHKDVKRYFMSIDEACNLVLQASALTKGGEIFVLDMKDSIKISTLAQKMIHLSGKNLQIKYVGLRDGEKLEEELFYGTIKEKYGDIFVVDEEAVDFETLQTNLQLLKQHKMDLFEVVNFDYQLRE
ncbi:MAG: polysaccharide biosynthesis protein [Epsilonproteobacteria bacterium]|nr:polysaccharide biosynthesis protein [Campylobacterota bacterium]